MRGSVTVEASIAIPLFLMAMVCMIFLLELLAIQLSVRSAMHATGKELSKDVITLPFVSTGTIEEKMVEGIGSERLEQSMIVGGASGIDGGNSTIALTTGRIELDIRYSVKLPFPQFASPEISYREVLICKGFTGYTKNSFEDQEEVVYVSDNGAVYHLDYDCSHLQLSIHTMAATNLESARNAYGGIYHPCERCKPDTKEAMVYVAKTGDRYHDSLSCSALKRSIHSVPISEVIGKGVCQRCGN